MERNAPKNGLINLVTAVAIFIAALGVSYYAQSLAGHVASIIVGLAALVAFVSWFQMRLVENERLEKLELDELTKTKGGSTLYEAKGFRGFSGSPGARTV